VLSTINTKSSDPVTQEEFQGFQLLIAFYLEQMKHVANPGLLIGYTLNKDATMKELFTFQVLLMKSLFLYDQLFNWMLWIFKVNTTK
jgi:hypothetical protein